MIRPLILMLVFICACVKMQAQINLVKNGGFEQYSKCPYDLDQIKYAYYWSSVDSFGSPDSVGLETGWPQCNPQYCNRCNSTSTTIGVPRCGFFNNYPRSGNGMVAQVFYFDNSYSSTYQREYLQGRFSNTLNAGKTYCITFYVILDQLSGYAINHIGAYIDDGSIDIGQDSTGCSMPQTSYIPQITETEIISDTANWTKIQGSYTATGNERYITIGNFYSVANTDTLTISYPTGWITGNIFSYYNIDDVSVIASDATANAGPDAVVSVGDSVLIGPTGDDGLPATWYVSGGTTPVGYGSNIWVHPTVNTTYVMELDLCGNVTRDSMMVRIVPTSAGSVQAAVSGVQVWPNPARGEVNVSGASGTMMVMNDMLGREVYRMAITADKQTIDIFTLPKGIYTAQFNDVVSGVKRVKKIVKE